MFRLVPPLFFIQSQNDSITLESFSSIIFGEFFCDFSNALMYKNCRVGGGYLKFWKREKFWIWGVVNMK